MAKLNLAIRYSIYNICFRCWLDRFFSLWSRIANYFNASTLSCIIARYEKDSTMPVWPPEQQLAPLCTLDVHSRYWYNYYAAMPGPVFRLLEGAGCQEEVCMAQHDIFSIISSNIYDGFLSKECVLCKLEYEVATYELPP